MLDADILGRDHLAVEHQLLGAVLLVAALDEPQHLLHEVGIGVVVVDPQTEELGRLDKAVDAYGQILACEVDIARVEQRQHALGLQLF